MNDPVLFVGLEIHDLKGIYTRATSFILLSCKARA